jgi:S1-C subfamily serine protease
VRTTSLLALGLLTACGASAPEPPRALPAAPAARAPAPAVARAPLTTLHRADVVGVLDAGFGSFLQRVEVEPSLSDGRFRGWTIVALAPGVFWDAVDLKPGDVVTSVNDLPIERDTEAFAAFQSLRTASELKVAYYRSGAARTLDYRIVE